MGTTSASTFLGSMTISVSTMGHAAQPETEHPTGNEPVTTRRYVALWQDRRQTRVLLSGRVLQPVAVQSY